MKKLLVAIIGLFGMLNLHAEGFSLSNLGVRLSIDASLPGDVSTGDGYTKVKMYENGPGFSFGAVYRFDLMGSLYIEPGLSLYYNTYSVNKSYILEEINNDWVPSMPEIELTKRSLRMFGLRVPVTVGYRLPLAPSFNLDLFTGPMFDFGMSADLHWGYKYDKYDLSYSASQYGSDRPLNRFNCYWNFGAGVTFAHHYSLSLQYDLGMCNRAKKVDTGMAVVKPKFHSNLVQLTFGYNF